MQVKKEEIKNKIVSVAERLFITRGYENTSLKQIADRSNISKSNIYRYFISKEEIYEFLTGTARKEIIGTSNKFFTPEFIEKCTSDKLDEISVFLTNLLSRNRSGILIMLRSSVGSDKKMIEEMIIKNFIEACPMDDENIKKLISRIMIFGLTEILLNYSDEKSMAKEVNALICYHYLGLNGVKSDFEEIYNFDLKEN